MFPSLSQLPDVLLDGVLNKMDMSEFAKMRRSNREFSAYISKNRRAFTVKTNNFSVLHLDGKDIWLHPKTDRRRYLKCPDTKELFHFVVDILILTKISENDADQTEKIMMNKNIKTTDLCVNNVPAGLVLQLLNGTSCFDRICIGACPGDQAENIPRNLKLKDLKGVTITLPNVQFNILDSISSSHLSFKCTQENITYDQIYQMVEKVASVKISATNISLNTSSQGTDAYRSLTTRLRSELGFEEAWTPESVDSLLRDVYRDQMWMRFKIEVLRLKLEDGRVLEVASRLQSAFSITVHETEGDWESRFCEYDYCLSTASCTHNY